MRILYVSQTLEKGGAENQISLIANGLRQFGHTSAVVALSSGGWWASYLLARDIPVSILNFPLKLSIFSYIKTFRELLRLVSLIKSQKPDVVISFLYSCSTWVSIASYLARVPVVVASRRDCGFQRIESPLPYWLEKLSYFATTKFVTNSIAVSESLQENEGIKSEKIEVIYNGVNIPKINSHDSCVVRKKLKISDSAVVVGMLANFWSHKNQLMLIRAAKYVIEQGTKNIVFVLAGCYWDYQKQVEAAIVELGIGAYVLIVGQVKNTSQLLPAFDIGVLCSQSEGFSNAILEYMAYGKPVIATHVGGNPEAVEEGKTGCLVDLNNDRELADAIIALVNNPIKRTRMGRNGRLKVETYLNWDVILKSWNSLLEQLSFKN